MPGNDFLPQLLLKVVRIFSYWHPGFQERESIMCRLVWHGTIARHRGYGSRGRVMVPPAGSGGR